jgi:methionyl-tRNA synthetase
MSYYVTTPIYYVNSSPHLGHAYTTICADVITRFQRLMGNEAFYLTGTDEHGSKIAEAATEAGEDVQAFVDRNAQKFRDLLPLLDARNDFFIRTTDAEHKAFVQQVATRMHEQGDIYEDTYSGWSCTGCERYYNDGELEEGNTCPIHKRPVEHMEETNWFFRLTAYKERLLEHFRANPTWIEPKTRYNEALSLIEQLEDLSISRSSITWGIDVPWDETQVFYVWIDALFNYASALTYARDGEDLSGTFWPPTVQVLAKDILKFHAVYWPAFLMSVGMDLPEKLFIHGYLTVGGDKMGKSMGNALDPFPIIDRHGPDPLRFYLLREVQFGQDGAVSQEGFERRYDGELANDLGNLVSRTAAMLVKYRGEEGVAKVPDTPSNIGWAVEANVMVEQWKTKMQALDLSGALETVWAFVRGLNRLVEERAPWKLAKDDSAGVLLDATLGELAEGLVAVAYTLSPVMPSTSAKVAETFGVSADQLASWSWGMAAGSDVRKAQPMFPRLETATQAAIMVEKWKAAMTALDLSGALEIVWTYVRSLNRLVEERAPWKLAKDESQALLLDATLGELAEGLVAISYVLLPVMPATSVKVAATFGVSEDELSAWSWGCAAGRDVSKPEPLFPRLEVAAG